MALIGKDLGIDLGTVNTIVSDGGEIVLHEPTMVAVDIEELKILARSIFVLDADAARSIAKQPS